MLKYNLQIDVLYLGKMSQRNNSEILSQIIFRKINEQNELKQSFSSSRSANDKKQQQQQENKQQQKNSKKTNNHTKKTGE